MKFIIPKGTPVGVFEVLLIVTGIILYRKRKPIF